MGNKLCCDAKIAKDSIIEANAKPEDLIEGNHSTT